MKLCLVSDSDPVCTAVKASCLPPHHVSAFGLQGLLNADNSLSDYGKTVVREAVAADVVLINWTLDDAPLINTLCYSVRKTKHFTPIVAICDGSREEMITALSAGVDDVTGLPLFIPLLQARVAAHKRLVNAVRIVTSKRIKKKLEKTIEGKGALPQKGSGQSSAVGDGLDELTRERIEEAIEKNAEILSEKIFAAVNGELQVHRKDPGTTEFGPLRLDRNAYTVFMGEAEVDVTPKEFDLLGFLIENGGQLCARDRILDEVWGIDFETGTNLVDVYMHFVRKKLAEHGYDDMLETVRSQGYRLVDMEASRAN